MMIELVEVQPCDPRDDLEIRQRLSLSTKAKFTKHFVAKRDEVEIGFVAIDAIPGVNYLVLYELFVITRMRGVGLGASLLDEVEKCAVIEGYEWVTLSPSPLELGFSTGRLMAWYKRHGYAERPDFPSELEKWII
jgi:GNAT superfamily N-acetyltransferase